MLYKQNNVMTVTMSQLDLCLTLTSDIFFTADSSLDSSCVHQASSPLPWQD